MTDASAAVDQLMAARYLSLDVELVPLGAPTIQPTTFANTGTSFYDSPDGDLAAVVDSVASLANQLELTIWDEARSSPTDAVAALPWVKVVDKNGSYYTSSRRAAHRLNAAAVMNGTVAANGELFGERLRRALDEPASPPSHLLASVVWEHDPLALIHGVWFPGIWEGRARLTRALSARIDARDVQTQSVQVGGQKTRDALDEPGGTQDLGFQTVRGEAPYYTGEISARRIVGSLLLDAGLLRSYGLGAERERALIATGLLQIGELIAAWPRRRSRCVLKVRDVIVREPDGFELPPLDALRAECAAACETATDGRVAEPMIVHWSPKPRKAKGRSEEIDTEVEGN